MAIGWSGSNGGIGKEIMEKQFNSQEALDISYFINNSCNLSCKHCYVGYQKKNNELSIEEWKKVFNELISLGALTFGNVGKEPLLSWNKTKEILEFLKTKREEIPKLRFGLVTNATLMNKKIIEELSVIMPDYIDISLDGLQKEHDYTRGIGNFDKTIKNLERIKQISNKLSQKVFISYTLMNSNKNTFAKIVKEISKKGFKNFLVSPYIETQNKKGFNNKLAISEDETLEIYHKIISGDLIDFNKYNGLVIILKNDYDTLKSLMDKCIEKGLIDLNALLIDEYGVIFNKYCFGTNKIIINYIPKDNSFTKTIRISHDGFVGNCYAQFFEDYPKRKEVIGNVRSKSIKKILESYQKTR